MINTLTTEFCLRLAQASATLVRRLDTALGAHHGISFGDYQLLLHLQQAPDGRLPRTDLANKLGLSASAVTRSLLPLEKIGLVSRQSDPGDARAGLALITPAGTELVTNADVVVGNVSRNALGSLVRAQRAEFEATSALLAQIAGLER